MSFTYIEKWRVKGAIGKRQDILTDHYFDNIPTNINKKV